MVQRGNGSWFFVSWSVVDGSMIHRGMIRHWCMINRSLVSWGMVNGSGVVNWSWVVNGCSFVSGGEMERWIMGYGMAVSFGVTMFHSCMA